MPISIPSSISPNKLKRAGAKVFDTVGLNTLGLRVQKALFNPFVRAVNYHVVEPEHADSFEEHLRFYREHFVSVDRQMLDRFFATGEWPHSRPGLILSFDDGDRTHYEVAAPLLERFGFTGWFFVPVGLMALHQETRDNEGDAIPTLTVGELKYLDKVHVVGSHSETHCRLGHEVPRERLESEISGSRRHLEEVLGHPIDIFCWVGGEEASYSRNAAELIRDNYRLSFMTNNAVIRAGTDPLQLQRTNVEAENPLSLVRFQLSGLMDLFYARKRRRVNRLTS